MEHSIWLDMMYPRLKIMHALLADDGSLWININDDECHYLKVMMDEVFQRRNFVSNCLWQKVYSPQNLAKWFSNDHDHILCYATNKMTWRPNLLPRTERQDSLYKNPDNDPRGVWMSGDLSVKYHSDKVVYTITTPSGNLVRPPQGRGWGVTQEDFAALVKDNRIWFGSRGSGMPRKKKFLAEVKQGVTPTTLWLRKDHSMICESCGNSVLIPGAGDNQDAKRETLALNTEQIFSTPKPERLIQRVLTLATKEGDLVLDAFLGSGTTAAVAHKMNRRYIGIEKEETAKTHACERLKKVIDGEQGGISKDIGWKGGGGFRFYTLTDEVYDSEGKITKSIKFKHLAFHIWFKETGVPPYDEVTSPFLGVYGSNGENTAYYLLYNGILGDKSVDGGNVLTYFTLEHLMNLELQEHRSVDWKHGNREKDPRCSDSSEHDDSKQGEKSPKHDAKRTKNTSGGSSAKEGGKAYWRNSESNSSGSNVGIEYTKHNGANGVKPRNDNNRASTANIEKRVIYGEACRLSQAILAEHNITFMHIPYTLEGSHD